MDYYGNTRSNYVKVKDVANFKLMATIFGLEIITDEIDFVTHYGFTTADGCGFPNEIDDELLERYNDNDPEYSLLTKYMEADKTDPILIMASFMEKGEILVVQHAGNEGMRYLSGWATAANNKGKFVSLNLDDIYAMAKKRFKKEKINEASY
jgi:hypothetical protein